MASTCTIPTAHIARIDAGIAAEADRLAHPLQHAARTVRAKATQFLRAVEPWYDWGVTEIDRMDECGAGRGYWLSFQWLGANATLFFGATPAKREA